VPKNDAAARESVTRERRFSFNGGEKMKRDERCRPKIEMKLESGNLEMPPKFHDSFLEELEAFKSILIQTQPRREQLGKESREIGGGNTELDTAIPGEAIDTSKPTSSIGCLPEKSLRAPSKPESHIGEYIWQTLEIREIIREGRSETVYCATDHSTQTQYAVKAFSKIGPDGAPLDQKQLKRQYQEIRLHFQASTHPNIASLFKIIDDTFCTYALLQYCPDGDLFTSIAELGRYVGNDSLIRTTILQLLSAVQHCHRLGIYHRDLKPENILVDRSQVLLTDFGIATTEPESANDRFGSMYCMSPRESAFITCCYVY
jgi:hypothetical protein